MQPATMRCRGMQAADAKDVPGGSWDSRAEEPACERGRLAGQEITSIGVLESPVAELAA